MIIWNAKKINNSIYCYCAIFSLIAVVVLFVVMGAYSVQAGNVAVYGLFETSFSVSLPYNNPFDASDIKVDAEIEREGKSLGMVPCFNDGDVWKLRYTPSQSGQYTYQINAKTASESEQCAQGSFVVDDSEHWGFLRIGKHSKRHFVFENGESYFALGENMGWVQWNDSAQLDIWIGYLDECQDAGINWIRIWMCPWGKTELTWTPKDGRYHGYKQYDLENARIIDGIFAEAQKRGIYIQWVINHHGQYSIKHNPEWQNNPFNTENGGFLEHPWEFFTNDEAKRHYRNRLRYLAARWGYSTHLLSWEFWNEVNLTANYDFPVVKAWHEEMAEYLREIDPYDHLLSTSTSRDFDPIFETKGMDFIQSHSYTSGLIQKLELISEKCVDEYPDVPHFFSEMAYDWRGPTKGDDGGISLHNQLWASVHATADAGTAMTWWWDNWVRPKNLYYHFKALAKYVDGIDWDKENLLPMQYSIEYKEENSADFFFTPPVDWGNSRRTRFTIKENGEVEGLKECTIFVHGVNHKEMAPNPIFTINAKESIEFGLWIDRVSMNGASCIIEVDGEQVFQRVFASGENDSTMSEDGKVSITVPPGRHNIFVKNTGQDWFQVKYYRVGNFIQRPNAYIRGNKDRILVWVHDRLHQLAYLSSNEKSAPIAATSLTLPEIREGEYLIEPFDPYTGEVGQERPVVAGDSGLVVYIPSFEKDLAFRIRCKPTAVGMPLR